MASPKPGKNTRRIRHRLLTRLNERLDRVELDYKAQTATLRPKSVLIAVASAFALYAAIFGVAFYAWHVHNVNYATFERLVWIVMIPCSVVGAIVYLIGSNRRQYDIEQRLKHRIRNYEGSNGLIWKLEPLITDLGLADAASSELIRLSAAGDIDGIDAKDYCNLVQRIFAALDQQSSQVITSETFNAVDSALRG